MNVRTATEADFNLILNLVNSAFQVERFFKNQDRLDPGDLARQFKEGTFLLTEDKGTLTGCINVKYQGDRGYFGLLSVDPAHQKSGVGRRLVAAAENLARETGAHVMDLKFIHLRAELLGIYRKMGYETTGTEQYPSERTHMLTQPVHFICMSKDLSHSK
ncbi:MAG: GNAT family N-acetyltransferase [Acidobacteriaceae bacterium]